MPIKKQVGEYMYSRHCVHKMLMTRGEWKKISCSKLAMGIIFVCVC